MANGLVTGVHVEARADGAMEGDEERRQEHLRQQQLKMLCRQAIRSPFAVIVAALFVAFAVWELVPAWKVVTWAAILMVFPVVRGLYSSRALRHPPADASAGLGFHVASTFTGGIVVGMAAPLFFESLSDERRAFLTMVLICWAAAGVSAMAAYARAYYAYVTPIVLQIAAAWALVDAGSAIDAELRFIAGALILFAGVIQSFFARDSERVLQESFRIRYENERLIAAIERERQQVALARDKAEAANRAKSRFLAAASHDLRQPLHALSLYSAALTVRAPGGDVGEIGRSINVAALSLSALVDSLLDISKLDAGAIQPQVQRVGVRSLTDRIEADFRPTAQAKQLEFHVQPADADIETDPVLLERILRNLVDNAMKYTARGSVTLRAGAEAESVRFSVSDTGPGIAPRERERVFEEFYQIGNPERDRAQGLGLGLAIVRRLARLLGTDVELESAPGKGAQFSIRVPRARREPDRAAPSSAPGGAARDGILADAHVLVIDDEPSVRVGMRTLLEAWGCRVTVAGGYAEAQQLVDQHGLGFDLIVADFRLRQHENGIDTVRRLRERLGEDVPALLVSGDTAPERLREAQDSGFPLLHKPVPPEKLQEALLDALRR
jgi:signal transduction histidine kinase/CheY-like chemotaxis protein